MTKEIIIEGINVNELQAQRLAIRKGAAQIVATNLETAKTLTRQIVECKNAEDIKILADKAYEALDIANMVSDASGITYYLAYSSNYDDADDIFSYILEGSENEVLRSNRAHVRALANLFSKMESNSAGWNSSWC